MITGTSGHDRKLEISDLNSRSDYDSFEVHKVWLIRNFKQPEVIPVLPVMTGRKKYQIWNLHHRFTLYSSCLGTFDPHNRI